MTNNLLKNWWKWINWTLFFILLMEIIVPSFYSLIRISFLSSVDDLESIYIGSLSQYTSLLYYIFKDAFVLGIYFYVGKYINKANSASVIKTVFIITWSILFLSAIILTALINPIVRNSEIANNTSDLTATINFLYINLWATILKTVSFIIFILLIIANKNKYLIYLIIIRFFSLLTFDFLLFIPGFAVFELGVIGYGLSDLISELIVVSFGIYLILRAFDISLKELFFADLHKNKRSFYRTASFSSTESLIRNIGYAIAIISLSQLMGEKGSIIWFITISLYWSFLLLPLYAMQEDIKKKASVESKIQTEKNTIFAYHMLALIIFVIWILLILVMYYFIGFLLNYSNNDQNLQLITYKSFLILFIFQFLYMITRIWDQVIYAKGETQVLLYRTLFSTTLVFLPVIIIINIDPSIIIGEKGNYNYLSTSIIYGIFLFTEFIFVWVIIWYLNKKYYQNDWEN